MKKFNNWDEYLKFAGSFEEKIQICRASSLGLVSPAGQRSKVWMGFIEPNFASDKIELYRKAVGSEDQILHNALNLTLKRDINKITLNQPNAQEKSEKLLSVLTIFLCQFPEILYHSGLCSISYALLEVFPQESEAFLMLCHLILTVFPKDYYNSKRNSESCLVENRAFTILSAKFRLKVVNMLAIQDKNSAKSEPNLMVFNTVMENLAEGWYKYLFSNYLVQSELYRCWDNLLIYGFEIAHKFALAILSKSENFFRNSLKQELKGIGLNNTLDALLISGMISKNKLLKKAGVVQIETLIKKILLKPSYTEINRNQLICVVDEIFELQTRLVLIREFKSTLEISGFTEESAKSMLSMLESHENDSLISRSAFRTTFQKSFNWELKNIIRFFIIFDQSGSDSLTCLSIKLAISMLVPGIDNKIQLFFNSIDQDGLQRISQAEFIQVILGIEENLYNKLSFYAKNIFRYFENTEDLTFNQFKAIIKTEGFFQTLYKNLEGIDSEELKVELRRSIEEEQNVFSDFSSYDKSPMSMVSEIEMDDVPELNLDKQVIVDDENLGHEAKTSKHDEKFEEVEEEKKVETMEKIQLLEKGSDHPDVQWEKHSEKNSEKHSEKVSEKNSAKFSEKHLEKHHEKHKDKLSEKHAEWSTEKHDEKHSEKEKHEDKHGKNLPEKHIKNPKDELDTGLKGHISHHTDKSIDLEDHEKINLDVTKHKHLADKHHIHSEEDGQKYSISQLITKDETQISETQKEIDLLPAMAKQKDRNSCSRLCTNQSCQLF